MMKLFYVIAILLVGIASSVPYNETAISENESTENESSEIQANLVPIAATISEIQANPVEDQLVTIEGQVTQNLGNDLHTFSDGTGTIQLEAENIPNSALPLNEKVDVIGEVELEDGVLEIDVDWVTPARGAPLFLSGINGKTTLLKVARPQM